MRKRQKKSDDGSLAHRSIWRRLGPGVITGAADDDPSGIATYSQAGAQFGFSTLWTMVLTYPLMSAIQEISARLGRVTGHGIAGNLRRHASSSLLYFAVILLLVANTLNLGADIGAMAEALTLIVHGDYFVYVVAIGIGSAVLQIVVPYRRYVFYLKWLTFSLLSYLGVMFFIHLPIGAMIHQTFLPHIQFRSEYFKTILALFGTTISPYLFFWQSSQEVEEVRIDPRKKPLKDSEEDPFPELDRIRKDTYIGMFFSNLVAYFIIVSTAATLNTHQIFNIDSAATAAKALEPLAGHYSFLLFALGIIGTGLLAVPVLAGSAAYAVGEALQWPLGLERKPLKAKRFYALIFVAILIGVMLNFLRVNPTKALFYCALLNGIIAVPLMILIMLLTTNKLVMGDFALSKPLQVAGWLATAVMGVSLLGMLF